MLTQLILYPVVFSFLFQITHIKELSLKYLFCRSKCDFCQKPISIIYLIPIINFIVLKGKTLCCKRKLKQSYFWGELLACGLIIILSMTELPLKNSVIMLIYFSLLVLALYDLETYTIPIHIPIIVLITTMILGPFYYLQGFGITIFLHLFFYCCKNQIGYGDILIFSMLSFLLPLHIFFSVIWFTFIISGCFSIAYIIVKHSLNLKIPLVPFIFCAFNTVALCYPLLKFGGGIFEY
ncbi:prepilin peptidase [Staphylococcus durrellii]|uniref:prepilin peptidase n=1 Tax=Staphylococcus durrellii TaxID=2781773 RepID=UPI00189FC238|nr:prepilin peptidase [Staphylococcus durrellii]MBF7016910.1 prepilin peptidase [Staphylococcus durrellii]